MSPNSEKMLGEATANMEYQYSKPVAALDKVVCYNEIGCICLTAKLAVSHHSFVPSLRQLKALYNVSWFSTMCYDLTLENWRKGGGDNITIS